MNETGPNPVCRKIGVEPLLAQLLDRIIAFSHDSTALEYSFGLTCHS